MDQLRVPLLIAISDIMCEAEELLLILSLFEEEEDDSFRSKLCANSKRSRKGCIRRGALLTTSQSPFQKLFDSRHDDALITMCGLNHHSFSQLHDLFQPLFNVYSPYSQKGRVIAPLEQPGGKPRLLSSVQCLGLALAWTRTRESYFVLQVIFGLTNGHLSLWLRYGRRLIIQVLHNHPLAKVRMPTDEEVAEYELAISAKYPALPHCWGAIDGLKVQLQKAGHKTTQNNFYNGWTHGHYVSNLFLFSPDGKVRASYINAPGTWHDSHLANQGNIYRLVDDLYQRTGSRIVADSAFAANHRPSILTSRQNNVDNQGNIPQRSDVHRQATSVRQMAEWGMRGLQGSFPRLKDRILYEERGERRLILHMIVLLYNFRASTVGQNQIQSSFMPHLNRSANRYATDVVNAY
jgi:hypothetical protein